MNLAWNVLVVGLKVSHFYLDSTALSNLLWQLVKAQQDRDDRIASLIQTMQSTYSIVAGSGHLRDELLQEVFNRILR